MRACGHTPAVASSSFRALLSRVRSAPSAPSRRSPPSPPGTGRLVVGIAVARCRVQGAAMNMGGIVDAPSAVTQQTPDGTESEGSVGGRGGQDGERRQRQHGRDSEQEPEPEAPHNSAPVTFAPLTTGTVPSATGPSATGPASTNGASANGLAAQGAAVWQFTEFNAAFNLQYLRLQEQFQLDSRAFNLISNIMKGNHADVKVAINNLR